MATETRATVRVGRSIPASPERVFDAWLTPGVAARWLFATPAGEMIRAEIDPTVGGRFTFVDRRDGVDVLHTGTYRAIDRPTRLAFTFAVPQYSPEETTVTVAIAAADAGCDVTLTHEGVPADLADRTAAGWTRVLDGLAAAVAPARPT